VGGYETGVRFDNLNCWLRGIPEVKEAHMVYGVYDIVARVEAETVQGLKDIVASNIRSIDKAHSTLNLVCT